MADRYWVGGTGTWNTTSTTNWSATPGGAGGASVPTSADSVFFDRTGTYTVTLTGALNCLDFNVSAGSVTFTSTGTINIAGSVSITNVTPTWSATGLLTFTATTAKTIATNGTTFSCGMTFNGVGGSWQLQSALTLGTTNTVTLTNGTLNLNNFTLQCGLFSSSNVNTRTIAFGTGNITTTGSGTAWTTATTTNLTITGTPLVNISNNSATATTVASGVLSEASSISFNFTTGTYSLTFLGTAGYTARNINFTGFSGTWAATSTGIIYGNITISTGMTLTSSTGAMTFGATSGTQTIRTNGKTLDFPITFNGVGGTFRLLDALTVGSTRTVTLTNGSLDLNSLTLSCGLFASNNSNTRTLAFGTGNVTLTGSGTVWNTTTTTNLTVTGTPIANLTNSGSVATSVVAGSGLPEASNISFNITAGTYALNFGAGFNVRNLNFTGFSGTWTWSGGTPIIYGSVTFSSGMTLGSNAGSLTFGSTSGTSTITTNGKTLDFPIIFNGVGGTWQLQDAMTLGSTRSVTLTNGTLDLFDKTLTCAAFSSSNSNTRTLAFGTSGSMTITGTGTVWQMTTVTGFTATGSEIVNISNNSATATTVTAGSPSEANALTFNFTTGTYALTISGNVNSLNFTGFAGSITGIPVTLYGSLTVSTGMTINASATVTTFAATSGIKTITTNGKTLDFPITFNGVGGTWQLQDTLTMGSTRATNLTGGTLNLNGNTFNTGSFVSSGSSARNVTFNGGSLSCIASGSVFTASGSAFTTTKGTGEGYITLSNTSNRTFAGGGFIYNCTLYVVVGGTASTVTISGANTFRNIQTNADGTESFISTINFPALTTTTFLVGFGLNYIAIGSSSPGNQATISLASGTVLVNNMLIQDSNATGGAVWKAKDSVDNGNNSGWIFLANVSGQFFAFF